MTPSTAAEPDALADLARRLGGVPADRILLTPPPGTATEDDLLRAVDGEPKRLVELIDGVLVEKAVGHRESLLAVWLGGRLLSFVERHDLGTVGAPDAVMRMANGRVRLPDVAFTSWERLPTDDAHLLPVAPYSGDLMVEILSEGNSRAEVAEKVGEYFDSGTRLVWVIDPAARTVAVYTAPDAAVRLTAADTLTGDPVLPGFVLPLAEMFNARPLNRRPNRRPPG